MNKLFNRLVSTGCSGSRASLGLRGLLSLFLLISLTSCNGNGSTDNTGNANLTGPQVIAAEYVDADDNGVDSGDILLITFDEPVRILSSSPFSIQFESLLDDLGVAAALDQSIPNSHRIEVSLGSGADFVPDVSTIDMRSGVNLNVVSLDGDDARQTSSIVTVSDISNVAPVLISATYNDSDLDGTINVGDSILCAFDKPIAIPGGSTAVGNFTLPVTGDSLGTGPTLSSFMPDGSNRGVLITLGANPVLTISGTFDPAILTTGSASGVRVTATPTITDSVTTGAMTIAANTEVDLGNQLQSFFRNSQKGSLFTGNTDASAPNIGPSGFDRTQGMTHYNGSVLGSPVVDLFFVADTENHRVLVFEGLPVGNNGSATLVLGQPDLYSNDPNQSTTTGVNPSASSMHSPVDVHFNGETNQLFVSDSGNHRVLVFSDVVDTINGSLLLTSGDPASFVIGQSHVAGSMPNQGSSPSSRGLSNPGGIHAEGGQFAVADRGNHRVLIWNNIPSTSNSAASFVLGQADFVSNSVDGGVGSIDGRVLDDPTDVVIDSTVTINGVVGAIIVADSGNNRVLVWNGTNRTSGDTADRVLGQALFTTDAVGSTTAEFNAPFGVEVFPTSLNFSSGESIFVSDSNNDRISVFSFSVGLSNGASADSVFGASGAPSDNTLNLPGRVSLSAGSASYLFVADTGNHRVMQFPVSAGVVAGTASAEQGQPSFLTAKPNGHTMNEPTDVCFVGGAMVVADCQNNRVLIYSSTPTSGDPDPDVVLGQPNLFDTSSNQGLGSPTASTLREPCSVATDGTRLLVSDSGNNRILIWNSIPTVTETPADLVLGQADMISGSPNSGGISASTLDSPAGLSVSGNSLFVCDQDNHRVLIWSDLTVLINGAMADFVLGQDDFSSRFPNHGDVVTASTLHSPADVLLAGGYLFVADSGNHRILGFASSSMSAIPASLVIGQSNFSQNVPGYGPISMNSPSGLASDGVRFFVSDSGNHRVLAYESVPIISNPPVQGFLGQSGASGNLDNRGSSTPTESSVSGARGLFFDGVSLYVADTGNSRILRVR